MFSLVEIYYDFWLKQMEFYVSYGDKMLGQCETPFTLQEWVGLYRNQECTLPKWVVCVGYLKEFSL